MMALANAMLVYLAVEVDEDYAVFRVDAAVFDCVADASLEARGVDRDEGDDSAERGDELLLHDVLLSPEHPAVKSVTSITE